MENQNSVPLKISNVIKTFDGHDVIKKFNLTIEEGSIYGLLGPNGAGKTTLFKLITGLQQLTNGKIEVFNRNIATQKRNTSKYWHYYRSSYFYRASFGY